MTAGSSGNLNNLEANDTAESALVPTIPDYGLPQSEDCLTLNVWTQPQVGDAKKAVLVWIYGGSFKTGSSVVSRNTLRQELVIFANLPLYAELYLFLFPISISGFLETTYRGLLS
jgi:hypothetical protein